MYRYPVAMSDHERAVREATRRYRQTEKTHEQAREAVVAAVTEALAAGERPTDVTAWCPFTAAYVRRLAREHGIEPAQRSRREA